MTRARGSRGLEGSCYRATRARRGGEGQKFDTGKSGRKGSGIDTESGEVRVTEIDTERGRDKGSETDTEMASGARHARGE